MSNVTNHRKSYKLYQIKADTINPIKKTKNLFDENAKNENIKVMGIDVYLNPAKKIVSKMKNHSMLFKIIL
tara:strand:- start:38 stop:250 length:213 start_codon:yes stop_codon:yes gene_type:complete